MTRRRKNVRNRSKRTQKTSINRVITAHIVMTYNTNIRHQFPYGISCACQGFRLMINQISSKCEPFTESLLFLFRRLLCISTFPSIRLPKYNNNNPTNQKNPCIEEKMIEIGSKTSMGIAITAVI